MKNWKKALSNVAGTLIGAAAIIHALPPAVVEHVHVPELLTAIAALVGLYQRSPTEKN